VIVRFVGYVGRNYLQLKLNYDDGGLGFALFILFQITHGTRELVWQIMASLRGSGGTVYKYDWIPSLLLAVILSLVLDRMLYHTLAWSRRPDTSRQRRFFVITTTVILFILFFLYSLAS